MVMIDKLNWSSHSTELEADRSGWQPRNKAWKAERQELWQRINTGPFVSYNDGRGHLTKAKDIKRLEEFFITGKSGFNVGKDNNPITLSTYLLFYPELSTEVLERIVPTLCPKQLNVDKVDWLLPRWQLYYMNYPEYFLERICLLQDYFWTFNPQTNEVNAASLQSLTNSVLSTVVSYASFYLTHQGTAYQPVVVLPDGWDNLRGLHYFFQYLATVDDKNSINIQFEQSWYKLFLHLRHYTPWNALSGAGLEQQQAFVATFISLIEQYGLPEKLINLWQTAKDDTEERSVTVQQLQGHANEVAAILVGEQLRSSAIKDIFALYKTNNFTDDDFGDAVVSSVDLSKMLSEELLRDYGFDEKKAVPGYGVTFSLNRNYGPCRQVVTLLMPVFDACLEKESLPRLFLVLRPANVSNSTFSRHDKYRGIYMRRLIAQQLNLQLSCVRNFSRMYVLQELERNPEKYPLTAEELPKMLQSGWYKHDQYHEPFIDKPYKILKVVPTAEDTLPHYDGVLPPFKFE